MSAWITWLLGWTMYPIIHSLGDFFNILKINDFITTANKSTYINLITKNINLLCKLKKIFRFQHYHDEEFDDIEPHVV